MKKSSQEYTINKRKEKKPLCAGCAVPVTIKLRAAIFMWYVKDVDVVAEIE